MTTTYPEISKIKTEKNLDKEMIAETEGVTMADENGKLHTAEQAAQEEARLESMMNEFFNSRPDLKKPLIDQFLPEEEEELAPAGEQPKEALAKSTNVANSGSTTVAGYLPYSQLEEAVLRTVITALVEELGKESRAVWESLNRTMQSLPNSTPMDNIDDAYRKERSHLAAILFGGEFQLERAPEHIQKRVLSRAESALSALVSFQLSGGVEKLHEERDLANKRADDLDKRLAELEQKNQELADQLDSLLFEAKRLQRGLSYAF